MARVGVTLAGHGYGPSWVQVQVKSLIPTSFKTSPRSCKTDKNWLRYGQKHVVSLSSPFLIHFGSFWCHFEGKTRQPVPLPTDTIFNRPSLTKSTRTMRMSLMNWSRRRKCWGLRVRTWHRDKGGPLTKQTLLEAEPDSLILMQ
jgi:hypothetical protein